MDTLAKGEILLPKGITAGQAGFFFTALEWLIAVLSSFLFLRILRLLMAVGWYRLPSNLAEVSLTLETYYKGSAAGIPGFIQVARMIFIGGPRLVILPLIIGLFPVVAVLFINISQLSLQSIATPEVVTGQISMPTNGWLGINSSNAYLDVSTDEKAAGSYSFSSYGRVSVPLRQDGLYKDSERDPYFYVRDGIVCHRGLDLPEEAMNESIAFCEGWRAQCDSLQELKLHVVNDKIYVNNSRRPDAFEGGDSAWNLMLQKAFVSIEGPDFRMFFNETGSSGIRSDGVKVLVLFSNGLANKSDGGAIVSPVTVPKNYANFTLTDAETVPEGGFTIVNSLKQLFIVWAGYCDLTLHAGLTSPSPPPLLGQEQQPVSPPLVRNWTIPNPEILRSNPVSGSSGYMFALTAAVSGVSSYSALDLSSVATASSSSSSSEESPKEKKKRVTGKELGTKYVTRVFAMWTFGLSRGKIFKDLAERLEVQWSVAVDRLRCNILWIGIGLLIIVIKAAFCGFLILLCRCLYTPKEASLVTLGIQNVTSIWGVLRSTLLAKETDLFDSETREGKVISALSHVRCEPSVSFQEQKENAESLPLAEANADKSKIELSIDFVPFNRGLPKPKEMSKMPSFSDKEDKQIRKRNSHEIDDVAYCSGDTTTMRAVMLQYRRKLSQRQQSEPPQLGTAMSDASLTMLGGRGAYSEGENGHYLSNLNKRKDKGRAGFDEAAEEAKVLSPINTPVARQDLQAGSTKSSSDFIVLL